jgi:hypothetical protein
MPIEAIQIHRSRLMRKAPICQHCLAEATHESKTSSGTWASLCPSHFRRLGSSSAFRQLISWGNPCSQAA